MMTRGSISTWMRVCRSLCSTPRMLAMASGPVDLDLDDESNEDPWIPT